MAEAFSVFPVEIKLKSQFQGIVFSLLDSFFQ